MIMPKFKVENKGIYPYCSKKIIGKLLKTKWFKEYQCQCLHCLKEIYICSSNDCDNYVKPEKKSSKYCLICLTNGDTSSYYDTTSYDSSTDNLNKKSYATNRYTTDDSYHSDSACSDCGGGDGDSGGD